MTIPERQSRWAVDKGGHIQHWWDYHLGEMLPMQSLCGRQWSDNKWLRAMPERKRCKRCLHKGAIIPVPEHLAQWVRIHPGHAASDHHDRCMKLKCPCRKARPSLPEPPDSKEWLEYRLQRATDALMLVYRKHWMQDESIGWDELGDVLECAMAESIGVNGPDGWITRSKREFGKPLR